MLLSTVLLPLTALLFLAVVVIGTETSATDDEKKRLGALLREHDYQGVRLIALKFAYKLARSHARRPQSVWLSPRRS